MVGPDRSLAVIRTTLDEVKAVAHANGATVNDVLPALTAGGPRAVLQAGGEPVEGTTVRTYVPVSLRRRIGGPQQRNLIAQMAIPLAMRESDAGDELHRIATETATRKQRARTSLGVLIRGRLARKLMLFAVMRQRVNVTTASIPGPDVPLYLCGARVLEVFRLRTPTGGQQDAPRTVTSPPTKCRMGSLPCAGTTGVPAAARWRPGRPSAPA
jgi:hypothetical protein